MFTNSFVAIAAYTVLEAMRNRLLWLVFGFIFGSFVLTEFIGEVAITESTSIQGGFLGAMLRGATVFMLCLFVITSVVREFNDKVLELVLSLPVPRSSYFLGKMLGYSALSILCAALCGLCLLIYVPATQVALWTASLFLELMLMTALSLLCLFTFAHVTLALSAVMAFYLLARTINAFQLIAESPLIASNSLGQGVMDRFIEGLAFLLPDLDRFTDSRWLIYHDGAWSELQPIALQTLVYLMLLSGAALFDLYRKNF